MEVAEGVVGGVGADGDGDALEVGRVEEGGGADEGAGLAEGFGLAGRGFALTDDEGVAAAEVEEDGEVVH